MNLIRKVQNRAGHAALESCHQDSFMNWNFNYFFFLNLFESIVVSGKLSDF